MATIGHSIALAKAAILDVWPKHEAALEGALTGHSPQALETLGQLADMMVIIGEDMGQCAVSYKWFCDLLMEEHLWFRRTGRGRVSSVADVQRHVAQYPDFDRRYQEGLLLSQVFWANHAHAALHFLDQFLPSLPNGAACLEIGPGHGLFTAIMARRGYGVTAVDISPKVIDQVSSALARMKLADQVTLAVADIFAPDELPTAFDAVILSEVLEHVDDPVTFLRAAVKKLRPGGLVYINVPVNSPAPDHVQLYAHPDEILALVASSGLHGLSLTCYPAKGYDLDVALRQCVNISCVVTARLPDEGSGAL